MATPLGARRSTATPATCVPCTSRCTCAPEAPAAAGALVMTSTSSAPLRSSQPVYAGKRDVTVDDAMLHRRARVRQLAGDGEPDGDQREREDGDRCAVHGRRLRRRGRRVSRDARASSAMAAVRGSPGSPSRSKSVKWSSSLSAYAAAQPCAAQASASARPCARKSSTLARARARQHRGRRRGREQRRAHRRGARLVELQPFLHHRKAQRPQIVQAAQRRDGGDGRLHGAHRREVSAGRMPRDDEPRRVRAVRRRVRAQPRDRTPRLRRRSSRDAAPARGRSSRSRSRRRAARNRARRRSRRPCAAAASSRRGRIPRAARRRAARGGPASRPASRP